MPKQQSENPRNSRIGAKGGFTLVEMLVVIAVIGLLAAIGIPMLTNIYGTADDSKDKRNAQIIASTAAAAQAAGDTTLITAADKRTAIDMLISGVSGAGAFTTTTFQVSTIQEAQRDRAANHLTLSDGILIYTPLD